MLNCYLLRVVILDLRRLTPTQTEGSNPDGFVCAAHVRRNRPIKNNDKEKRK